MEGDNAFSCAHHEAAGSSRFLVLQGAPLEPVIQGRRELVHPAISIVRDRHHAKPRSDQDRGGVTMLAFHDPPEAVMTPVT
jgi:hypothetical protein